MSPRWILTNPDTLVFPALADDPYVALEVHTYDPFAFAGPHPTLAEWGTPADHAFVDTWVDGLAAWAARRGVSVVLGEFGVTNAQMAEAGRVSWYAYHRRVAHGAGFAILAWDDDGMYRLLNRSANTWDAPIVKALGL